ncbi:MAG: lysophospholipid acyltransferase family protein [Victivallaceae bacterium]|nr:lysophospholipid acyltransferase family protein [Victivallaceae bacterium]
MTNLFPNNTYDTDPKSKRNFISKITFNSRCYFFLRTAWVFYLTARCARRGRSHFNLDKQVYYCNKNIRTLERCGAKIHLRGLDNLDSEEGPFVIIGNHMSSLETVVLNSIIGSRLKISFIFKSSLLKVPYLGTALMAQNSIPIDRVNPREDFKTIITEGKNRLQNGHSVLVFPQSTRSPKLIPQEFNTIGVKLARAAEVKVIPLALKTDFLGRGKIFKDFGPLDKNKAVYFEFGAPITVEGNGRETHQQVIEFIQSRLDKWNEAEAR